MDTVSLNASLRSGGHSVGTDSPNLSMKSWGFTNDTDSVKSRHWNFFLAANFIDVDHAVLLQVKQEKSAFCRIPDLKTPEPEY
ncbi:hypothetical protein MHYP_G00352350 [Metynnis hypsauchen]